MFTGLTASWHATLSLPLPLSHSQEWKQRQAGGLIITSISKKEKKKKRKRKKKKKPGMFELELLTLERGITCGLKWMAAMWRGFVFESIGISSVDQQEYMQLL